MVGLNLYSVTNFTTGTSPGQFCLDGQGPANFTTFINNTVVVLLLIVVDKYILRAEVLRTKKLITKEKMKMKILPTVSAISKNRREERIRQMIRMGC